MPVLNSIQATSLVLGLGSLLGTALDVGGLHFETTRSDSSVANVHVTGTVKASIGPLSTARRLNLDLLMRQEGGKWRYCDSVQRVANQLRQ